MPTINRLKLENYRSLQQIDFELKPLNILIGRNGAGKSNVLNFFNMMRRAADENLSSVILGAGGLSALRWQGSKNDAVLRWDIEFDNLKNISEVAYLTGEIVSKGNTYAIQLEEVSRTPNSGYDDRFKYLGAYNGIVKYLSTTSMGKEGNVSREFDYDNERELMLTQIRDQISYPLLHELRRSISDWVVFRGFGENAIENIYDSQTLEVVSPLRLEADGSNLISILHMLNNEFRYEIERDQLDSILKAAFADYQRMTFPIVGNGKAELKWQTKHGSFPARSISDGMIRFLGLATLLLLPDPPSLIALDEPEIGLHPKLLPLLAGLLKQASARTQIIVSTHSPQLISADDIDAEDVVIVEQIEGATVLNRLEENKLRLWLDRYSIGTLWTMGKLEQA